MKVEVITEAKDIVSLLICAESNDITWKQMFSTYNEYQKWLLNAVYSPNRYVVYGLVDDIRVVSGYLVVELVNAYNYKELFVHDVFIAENNRNKDLSQILFRPLVELTIKSKVKRLRWCSTQVPEEFWKSKVFDFEVKTLKYYYIETDEKTLKHYEHYLGGAK